MASSSSMLPSVLRLCSLALFLFSLCTATLGDLIHHYGFSLPFTVENSKISTPSPGFSRYPQAVYLAHRHPNRTFLSALAPPSDSSSGPAPFSASSLHFPGLRCFPSLQPPLTMWPGSLLRVLNYSAGWGPTCCAPSAHHTRLDGLRHTFTPHLPPSHCSVISLAAQRPVRYTLVQ